MWYVVKEYKDEEDVKLIHDCREGMAYKTGEQSLYFVYKIGCQLIMPVSFYGSYKQARNTKQYAFAVAMGFNKELIENNISRTQFEDMMNDSLRIPGNFRIGRKQVNL